MNPGDLPPRKRRAFRIKPPSLSPSPSPPPPPVARVTRRRTAYLTCRRLPLIEANGKISKWIKFCIRPQNLGGYQELRVALYEAAGANVEGVSHDHQAVIYNLSREDIALDRNQPFKRLDARFNWNRFANSVQRFRIVWVPLSKNKSNKPTTHPNPNKNPGNRSAKYSNAKRFLYI